MSHAEPAADRWLLRGLLLLIFTAALPWGGNRPSAMLIYGLWLGLLVLWSLLMQPAADSRIARWPRALGLIWLLWLILQAVPLPASLLGRITPFAQSVHAAIPIAGWNTISLAPGATVSGFFLSLAFAQAYWLASRHIRRSQQIRALLWVVVAAAAWQAVYGSVMTLSGLEWGVLEPKLTGRGVATGTFINRNHLAAYLGLGLAAGIGLMVSEPSRISNRDWRSHLLGWIRLLLSYKLLLRTLLAAMVIALVLTRSRMGNIAFSVALAVAGSVWLLLRRSEDRRAALLFFVSLLAVDLLIISRYFGLEALVQRVQQTELRQEGRVLVFADLVPAIRQHALLGAGYGAFPQAFAAVQSPQVPDRYEHAHNDYAEFLIESGVIGTLALTLFVAWHLLHALRLMAADDRRVRAGLGFAVFFALTALAVHGTADFNLRIPAIPLTLMVFLGALSGCRPPSKLLSRRMIDAGIIQTGSMSDQSQK